MIRKLVFIFIFCFFIQNLIFGTNVSNNKYYLIDTDFEVVDSIETSDFLLNTINKNRPNPLFHLFREKNKKNKKITAAILAFPFPFGIVGLHRIYLGTAPYVPVVYIASLGGVFGVLPFIDFCVLVLDKDEKRYVNNKKVFMWVN